MNLLHSIFYSKKNADIGQRPLQCPSFKRPKTSSRAAGDDGRMFKTINSAFFDPNVDGVDDHSPENSWFTDPSESASRRSTESEDPVDGSVEALVRSVRSDRLFFEPHGDKRVVPLLQPFKESVVLAMESEDPYVDFKRSMEEIVESSRIKDWDCLEELLAWYLRMNSKGNHEVIVEAFIDLLLDLNKGRRRDSNKNGTGTDVTFFSSAASSCSDGFDSNGLRIYASS
ncbi:hypothetical protein SAY86_027546 [Trapa natans]|uniref:Transcription repressor n=1 Tax=Trapa natans TaxID=22666 RepID=A0AAN7QJG2_TRANT|nr:hypothetical protein SAY86_027546 [Trapa natans]